MITEILLKIPLFFINLVLGLIPASTGLPEGVENAVTTGIGYLEAVSWFFPVETLFQVVLLIIAIDAGILLWHFINWIIKKIPGMQ